MAVAEKTRPAVRAAQINLFGLNGVPIVSAGVVVTGDDFPLIVMWNGDPYLRDDRTSPDDVPTSYRCVKSYRLDIGA